MPPSMPPLSIVHVVAPARYGGLETVVTALARELVRLEEKREREKEAVWAGPDA